MLSSLRAAISLKTGLSATARRIRYPTTISTMDSRNGTRQPQAAKSSLDMLLLRKNSRPVARIMPTGTPICGYAPNMPRLLMGACSTAIRAAPPHSPPAEKPWMIRRVISRMGAQTPIWLYVGSMPISAVAAPIMTRVNTSMALRPSRSPRWPATTAPSGRNRKLMPMRAKERICARPGLESCSGVRNSGDSSVPVSWAKMKKSYHSMVVPTSVPARTLRSSCLCWGPARESTKEGAVIGTPWLKAGVLPGETPS